MKKPRVLIGYSRSISTRLAFYRAGCEAWTCDLLAAENPYRHLKMDIWQAIDMNCWDFALFHPMCTYLTVSAAWAYKDGPYHQKVKPGTLVGAARREARAKAIKNFIALQALPFPVICENPAPSFLNKALCPPHQIVQPYQFGNDASKSTGLWFNHAACNMPKLQGTDYIEGREVCKECKTSWRDGVQCPRCGARCSWLRWGNQTDSGQNRLSPSDDRWLARSRTYDGMAAAMGKQWGEWLVNNHY